MKSWMGVLALAAAAVGCGGPAPVPAGGTVTYNGQPVANANIVFTPTGSSGEAGGRIATGQTDAQGKFTLSTEKPDDGAVPGDYTVTVAPKAAVGVEGDYSLPAAQAKPPFPAHYTDPTSSPLKQTVNSGNNQFTLEIKD